VHAFWKQLGQKPKDRAKSEWAVQFIMQATTTYMRQRVRRYAVILDGLMQDQVVVTAVAARIKELGGVDAAYEAMRGRDQSSSCQIGASMTPELIKRAPRSRPQRTLEDVAAAHEAVHGLPAMIGGEGAFRFVQRLAREYAAIKDGDHQGVSRVLQCAYLAMRKMQCDPDELERLTADPFWKPPWRRPKDASTSKWLMYFIVQARTPDARELASKYAEILDGLQRDQVEIGAVAARIKELFGIEASYQAMRARTTRHESCVTHDTQTKRTPPMASKSQQPDPPTTRTAEVTDGFPPIYFDNTAGPESGYYYIIGRSGEKIRLRPGKPPRPPRKLNDFDRWGKRLSQCEAQLGQARTKEERDRLNKEIRVLEQLIQERRAKILDQRLAARTKRRLGW
jgi:hypothetical protein